MTHHLALQIFNQSDIYALRQNLYGNLISQTKTWQKLSQIWSTVLSYNYKTIQTLPRAIEQIIVNNLSFLT